MSKMLKIPQQGYDELWVDLDLVTTVGMADVGIATPWGQTMAAKAVVMRTAAGERLFVAAERYEEIVALKTKDDPNDVDVPEGILNAWKDDKGDSEAPATEA